MKNFDYKAEEEIKGDLSQILESLDIDCDYELIDDIIISIEEYKTMLEDGISFEQIEEMVNYDISLFIKKKKSQKKFDDLYDHVSFFHRKYPQKVAEFMNNDMLKNEYYSLFNVYKDNQTVVRTTNSAKAKKIALGLLKRKQMLIEEETMVKCFN